MFKTTPPTHTSYIDVVDNEKSYLFIYAVKFDNVWIRKIAISYQVIHKVIFQNLLMCPYGKICPMVPRLRYA